MRHAVTVATTLTLLSVILSGCGWVNTVSQRRRITVAHIPGTPIEVEAKNGSVTIRRGSGSEVMIEAEIRAVDEVRLDEAEVLVVRRDVGTLHISATWPGGRRSNEGCAYTITMPDIADVVARSSNGRITVEGAQGSVDAKTSNGKIKIEQHTGAVEARTSNGRVKIDGALTSVYARSSNGKIEVAGATGPIDLETSNGKIEVELAPDFRGTIGARTSNGRVKLDRQLGVTARSIKKRSGTVSFGEGPQSRLKTSNGSIVIE